MPRIPTITERDQLAPEHQREWDGILASRGRVAGPWAVMLQAPALAGLVADAGALLRFGLPLPGAIREFVILATVRELKCEFEWAAHVPIARKEGVREEAIAAVRDGRAPEGLTPEEAEYVAYVHQIMRRHRVDDATFEALERRLGRVPLVELTSLIGYYCLVGTVMDAFAVEAPPNAERMPD